MASEKQPNKLLVKFPNSWRAGKYDVWTTDYENYAVVYSCTSIIPYIFKIEFIWILSRQPVMSEITWDKLIAELKLDSNVSSLNDFEKTKQRNCTY